MKINLGCGEIRPEGWLNIDSSFNSFIQNYAIGRFVAKKLNKKQYKNGIATYMNLNKPWRRIKTGSVSVVYASHLFEHLSLNNRECFLQEANRVLQPKGTIRIVVPDMEGLAEEYLRKLRMGDEEAIVELMWALNLHKEGQYSGDSMVKNIVGFFQGYPHQHKYMYDAYSLTALMNNNNFKDIMESKFGESTYIDSIFEVECDAEKSYENSIYIEAKKY